MKFRVIFCIYDKVSFIYEMHTTIMPEIMILIKAIVTAVLNPLTSSKKKKRVFSIPQNFPFL